MNRDEARAVLEAVKQAWPQCRWTAERGAEFLRAVRPLRADDVLDAVAERAANSGWLIPPVDRLAAACRRVASRRATERATERAETERSEADRMRSERVRAAARLAEWAGTRSDDELAAIYAALPAGLRRVVAGRVGGPPTDAAAWAAVRSSPAALALLRSAETEQAVAS